MRFGGRVSEAEVVDSSDDDGQGTQPRHPGGGRLFGALSAVVVGAQPSALLRPVSKLEKQEAEEHRMLREMKNKNGEVATTQGDSTRRARVKSKTATDRPLKKKSTAKGNYHKRIRLPVTMPGGQSPFLVWRLILLMVKGSEHKRKSPHRSLNELLEPTPFELKLKKAFDEMDADGNGTLD